MNQHTGSPHTERVRFALRLGAFSVPELARMLCVSHMTVRRALVRLARRKLARTIALRGFDANTTRYAA